MLENHGNANVPVGNERSTALSVSVQPTQLSVSVSILKVGGSLTGNRCDLNPKWAILRLELKCVGQILLFLLFITKLFTEEPENSPWTVYSCLSSSWRIRILRNCIRLTSVPGKSTSSVPDTRFIQLLLMYLTKWMCRPRTAQTQQCKPLGEPVCSSAEEQEKRRENHPQKTVLALL